MLLRKDHVVAFAASVMLLSSVLFTNKAHAHVTLISGPGYANQTQVITFGVAHGCSGADTGGIEVTIPKEITGVRALPNVFGDVKVNKDDAGVVTSVAWTKPNARPADDSYYSLSIRALVP